MNSSSTVLRSATRFGVSAPDTPARIVATGPGSAKGLGFSLVLLAPEKGGTDLSVC